MTPELTKSLDEQIHDILSPVIGVSDGQRRIKYDGSILGYQLAANRAIRALIRSTAQQVAERVIETSEFGYEPEQRKSLRVEQRQSLPTILDEVIGGV